MLCTLPTQKHPVSSQPEDTAGDLVWLGNELPAHNMFSWNFQVCCAVGPPTHTEKSCSISIIKPRKTLVFNSYTSTCPRMLDGICKPERVRAGRQVTSGSDKWQSMRSSFRHRTDKKRRSNTHLDVSQWTPPEWTHLFHQKGNVLLPPASHLDAELGCSHVKKKGVAYFPNEKNSCGVVITTPPTKSWM